MSSPVRSEDPENPGSSPGRCRCLDYCLVISLVMLTMVVGSLCIVYMSWERPHLENTASASIQREQQRSSAQLMIENAVLENNSLMEWSNINTFVGKYFSYEKKEIVVRKTGLYYIYSQMALACVDKPQCKEDGAVSLLFLKNTEEMPILKLNTQIRKSSMNSPPSTFSAGIRYLEAGDRIRAQLRTSHNITDWQVEQENSFLGLFWISGGYDSGN